MTIVNNPKITAKLVGASVAVPNSAQRVLFVGQMTSAGSATAGELYTDVDEPTAKTLFGPPSQLYNGIEFFKTINTDVPIDVIPLDDPAGVAADGKITFTATSATEAGSLIVTLAETRNGQFEVPVVIGDDGDAISLKAVNLIQAGTKCLMSAAVDGAEADECNVTSESVGTIGNNLTISVTGTVAGVTHSVTGMANGTLIPTLTNVFDVIGETRYQTVVWPPEYGTTEIKALLDARFNVVGPVKDGVAIMTDVGTESEVKAVVNAENSQSLLFFVEETTSTTSYKGGSMLECPYSQSAIFAAIRSLRLTDGANIARYVNGAGGARDTTGGPAIASLPYFNTPVPGLPVPRIGFGWKSTEIKALEDAGASVMGSNVTGTDVLLGQIVTTYKTDIGANPDVSWKYLNYVDTGSQSREYQVNNVQKDFVQSRLTTGDLEAFRNIANENSIRDAIVGYYGVLSSGDYVLLRSGEETLQFFKEELTVLIDLAEGKVTILEKLPIVTQLREIDLTMQLAFSLQ